MTVRQAVIRLGMQIALLVGMLTLAGGSVAIAADPLADLSGALRGSDPKRQFDALEQLGSTGPRAVRFLPEVLKLLASPDIDIRYEALVVIGGMGPKAAPALPALLPLIGGDTPDIVRIGAMNALVEIGPPAIEPASGAVRKLTESKDPLVRLTAARVLATWHARSPDAARDLLPVLIGGLSDPATPVRTEAQQGLVALDQAAAPALARFLGSDPEHGLTEAGLACAQIGPRAEQALPALLALLKHKTPDVRASAALAVAAVSGKSETVLPALMPLLKDEAPSVRAATVRALGSLGSAGGSAAESIAARLSDSDDAVRRTAAQALGQLGPAAAPAVAALGQAWADERGAVTLAAANALSQIGPAAVPVLAEKLEHAEYRLLAAAVLSELGPAAKDAVPALIRHVHDEDRMAQREVLLALSAIGPDARSAIPELTKVTKGPKAAARGAAAYALARIGGKEVLPTLVEALNTKDDPLLQLGGAVGLAFVSPDNDSLMKQSLPVLMAGLTHELPLVRRVVAEAIGQLGARGRPATPALVRRLNDEDPSVRGQSLASLANLGSLGPLELPLVIDRLSDPDIEVRNSAAYALGRMGKGALPAVPPLEEMYALGGPREQVVAAWALVKIVPSAENKQRATARLLQAIAVPNPAVRTEIASTLADIATPTPEVLDGLQRLAKDEDPQVRKAAEGALKKLKP